MTLNESTIGQSRGASESPGVVVPAIHEAPPELPVAEIDDGGERVPAGVGGASASSTSSEPPRMPSREELVGILERLSELQVQSREANRIAEHRERSMDRMHDELVALRAGELLQAMLPILRDIVRLHDDLDRAASIYESRGESAAARDLGLFRDAVTDVLYRQGVESYVVNVGERFDPKIHRAMAGVPTGDLERDRTVARVVRIGFRSDAKPIRMAEVEVHRHDPALAPPTTSPNPSSDSDDSTRGDRP